METVFIIVGLVGFAFLVLGFLVDDLFHFDFLDGAFGTKALATLATAFGIVGYGMTRTEGVSTLLATVVALIVGVICAGVVVAITSFLMRSETGEFSAEDLVGKRGTLINPVGPGTRGQVEVSHDGMNHIYNAESTVAMGTGATVRLIRKTGLSTFAVENASNPYDPINQN